MTYESLGDIPMSELSHHGIKGMKWGVRRTPEQLGRNRAVRKDKAGEGKTASKRKIKKLDKKYDKQFAGTKGWVKVQNNLADRVNKGLDSMNAKPEYKGKNFYAPENKKLYDKYLGEYESLLKKSYADAMRDFGTNASGTKQIQIRAVGKGENMTWEASLKELKHADWGDLEGGYLKITPRFDNRGRVISQSMSIEVDQGSAAHSSMIEYENELSHYGVKGMKWGVRRTREQLGRARTNRMAKKDATESAKAKMFYGEGAGTRRKLIKAKVESRSEARAGYREAFDAALKNQDMAKRASQAKGARRRADISKGARKTARGIGHVLRGNSQYANITAVAAAAAGTIWYQNGGREAINRLGHEAMSTIQSEIAFRRANEYLKNQGLG